MSGTFDVGWVRRQFPGLARHVAGKPAVFFDGPAGSQVPRQVADAVFRYLTETNANHGGAFATSRESDSVLQNAHQAVADFIGAADPATVVFGANMTTLTFAFSRALAHTWKRGDEVVVTRLDHDANVTPWVRAAQDAGAVVRRVSIQPEDCTLDMADFESKLSGRTRLVAVGLASNATGSINRIRNIVDMAKAVGAQVFVDAVHYAPHGLIDVDSLGCDYLVCSAYKFFGPHVGILWGKRELLESVPVYKVRPAPEALPHRWMTGTQNHEGIVGTAAAVDYLCDLGRSVEPAALNRRDALQAAYGSIVMYERGLAARLLDGLAELPHIRIFGIRESGRMQERVPTVSFTQAARKSSDVAEYLAERGIFVWAGNFYASEFTDAMNLEPDGVVRVGLLHYNTADEIDRLLEVLAELR